MAQVTIAYEVFSYALPLSSYALSLSSYALPSVTTRLLLSQPVVLPAGGGSYAVSYAVPGTDVRYAPTSLCGPSVLASRATPTPPRSVSEGTCHKLEGGMPHKRQGTCR
eukprot:3871219-Rhodomonas_salina.1